MIISVIVCTKNRKEELFKTVDSLASQQRTNEFSFEVIIIDSSYDDSMKQKLLQLYPEIIKYYWDNNLNLSEARNLGINFAKGEIVAFIDDDGIAEKSWLFEHYKMYFDPTVVSVGGKIEPEWLSRIPPWLSPEILAKYSGYLSLLDLGNNVKQIRYPEIPFGCNMSFKRDIFLDNLLFEKRLGRSGKTLMSNEEAYIYYLLDKKQFKIMYTPFAKVYHQIDSSRLTKAFFNRRSYWDGASNACMDKMIMNKKRRITKHLKFLVAMMPKNIIGYILCSWILRSRYKTFVHKTRIIYSVGYLFEGIKSF